MFILFDFLSAQKDLSLFRANFERKIKDRINPKQNFFELEFCSHSASSYTTIVKTKQKIILVKTWVKRN